MKTLFYYWTCEYFLDNRTRFVFKKKKINYGLYTLWNRVSCHDPIFIYTKYNSFVASSNNKLTQENNWTNKLTSKPIIVADSRVYIHT